jgi:glycosyltransferase involved in cell wall biosynthesis
MSELESLASGKAVISYFDYPEAYSEPPPVLTAQASSQVVEHITFLIENPEFAREIGMRGREWVVKHHGTPGIARRLIKAYSNEI